MRPSTRSGTSSPATSPTTSSPRASRAARHVAAAGWLESKAARVEDLADVLAHHYTTALELARAAGRAEQAAQLEAPTRRFLRVAGERTLGLDTAAALASFERALELTPAAHPDRPRTLARFGDAAFQAARYVDAAQALDEAITALRASGEVPAATTAMITLSKMVGRLGDPRSGELAAEALELLEPLAPGPELVAALTEMAIIESIHGRAEDGLRHAEQALAVAERLGLARPARALGFRGLSRCVLGDRGGLEDFRTAIVLATDAGQGREAALLYNNLATALSVYEGPVAALEVYRAGIEFAQARGLTEMTDVMTASTIEVLCDSGEHDEALTLAAELAGRFESSDVWGLAIVRVVQVGILTLRGQAAETVPSLDWLAIASRRLANLELIIQSLLMAAAARAALGQHDDAAALLSEIDTTPDGRESPYYAAYLPTMVRTALTIADPQLAHQLATGLRPRHPIAEHALVARHREPRRGTRRARHCRRRLSRRRPALAAVRRDPRTRPRAARPRPLPDRSRPTHTSHPSASTRPCDLPNPPRRPRPHRNRHAAAARRRTHRLAQRGRRRDHGGRRSTRATADLTGSA